MEVKGGFEEKSFNREKNFSFSLILSIKTTTTVCPLISIKKMLVLVEHTLLIVKRLFTKVFIAL